MYPPTSPLPPTRLMRPISPGERARARPIPPLPGWYRLCAAPRVQHPLRFSLVANRQRIAKSGGSFIRHRITPLKVGRSRHFRRRLVAVQACIAGRERRERVTPQAGDWAAQRVFSRQSVRFPMESPALTRGCRQRGNGSKRAPKCREQHLPPPPIEAMRWRSEATKTKRCAGGKRLAMRCRFAPSENRRGC